MGWKDNPPAWQGNPAVKEEPAPIPQEDPSKFSLPEAIGRNLAEGATLGGSGEIAGVGGALFGEERPGEDWKQRFRRHMAETDEKRLASTAGHPIAGPLADAAGGLMVGGAAGKFAKGAPAGKSALETIGKSMWSGAKTGGVLGGAEGGLRSNEDGLGRLWDAIKGAVIGGTVGGAFGGVGGVGQVARNNAPDIATRATMRQVGVGDINKLPQRPGVSPEQVAGEAADFVHSRGLGGPGVSAAEGRDAAAAIARSPRPGAQAVPATEAPIPDAGYLPAKPTQPELLAKIQKMTEEHLARNTPEPTVSGRMPSAKTQVDPVMAERTAPQVDLGPQSESPVAVRQRLEAIANEKFNDGMAKLGAEGKLGTDAPSASTPIEWQPKEGPTDNVELASVLHDALTKQAGSTGGSTPYPSRAGVADWMLSLLDPTVGKAGRVFAKEPGMIEKGATGTFNTAGRGASEYLGQAGVDKKNQGYFAQLRSQLGADAPAEDQAKSNYQKEFGPKQQLERRQAVDELKKSVPGFGLNPWLRDLEE